MPPNLDIYCLTTSRNDETINTFLDTYSDRAKCEDRGDEELMIRKLDAPLDSDRQQDYDWEPTATLSLALQRGLEYPRRSFSIYLEANSPEIAGVILAFSEDDQLILGLSIDDEGEKTENLKIAKDLLHKLVEEYDCHMGLILVESPPPFSQEMFQKKIEAPYDSFFLYSFIW